MAKTELLTGWTHCQYCGNPVPPIAEVDVAVAIEYFRDPDPVCQDCVALGREGSLLVDLEEDKDHLPF